MFKSAHKLMAVCVVAVFSMVASGCSTNNNGAKTERDQALADLATATTERDTATAKVTELEGELADANSNTMGVQGMLDTATARVTELEDMLAAAPTQADVDAIQGMLDTATARVTELDGELVTARQERDDALTELAEFKKELRDELAEKARDERIDRADAITTAMNDKEVRVPSKYKARTEIKDVFVAKDLDVERDADGMVTVEVGDDDFTGGEAAASSDAWTSATLTRAKLDDSTDTLVIYTNIDAPADVLFTKQYKYASAGSMKIFERDNRGKLQSSGFPAGGDDRVYDGDTHSKSFQGSFDGVDGVFTCTNTQMNCTISAKVERSKVTLTSSQEWTFIPNNPNSDTVKVPEKDYAYFGWWLNKPKKPTADHSVDFFSGGTPSHEAKVSKALVGTARYAGPAAGQYATKTFSAGVQTDAAAGHFTADANLTAKFGENGNDGSIDGAITNFVLDSRLSNSWKVTLEGTDNLEDSNATFEGATAVDFGGGKKPMAGHWQGSFYDADVRTTDTAKRYPGAVSGIFDAVTDNASLIGGFGAEKQ